MKISKLFYPALVAILLIPSFSDAQGYLHTSGKYIYDANNQEVILRGIGTGNWMINEGYMMRSSAIAGTHTEFRNKLTATIGETNTAAFYESWLDNHFTKRDLDSMKVWGFNSLRVAMHYKWFTLPIEDEPVTGQDTWFESGFVRIDTLLKWCSQNQMYLILDLHGAPGGQGHDRNISDYDPTKPSLWESYENRRKTVALWKKLAQRYAVEPWIGGYDMINEPNWDLPNGTMLKQLYVQITDAIRTVDNNHIIFVEGNWFANDYTGLTPPWDNNLVYSFHKYWNPNTLSAINWMINLRNTHNIPIWLGETGENSNVWFTSLIALCESKKIGWSWWPVKKSGINNVLQSPVNQNYDDLINYWTSGTPVVTPAQAFSAVMQWSVNHKTENCVVKYDVIDAMMRQPYTTETKPFVTSKPGEKIFFANYNLGRNNYAYFDTDTANTGNNGSWNLGWEYRNDGVDIEACDDTVTANLGYSVGWVISGEWMEYTLTCDSAAAYTVEFRSAALGTGGGVRLVNNGIDISPTHYLPTSGGWQTWKTSTIENVIVPAGTSKIQVHADREGSNLNFFTFKNPVSVDQVSFGFLTGQTSPDGSKVLITLNKPITGFSATLSDFALTVNNTVMNITALEQNQEVPNGLILTLASQVKYGDVLKISYSGITITSGQQLLEGFNQKDVRNTLPFSYTVPCTIEAENFNFNNGFQMEDCTDTGGGQNAGFANSGDYLDYSIFVSTAGEYTIDFRVASIYSNGRVDLKLSDGTNFTTLRSIAFTSTGGWQTWKNQTFNVQLPAGSFTFRIFATAGEFNINWFKILQATSIGSHEKGTSYMVQPNPNHGLFQLTSSSGFSKPDRVSILDLNGRLLHSRLIKSNPVLLEVFDIQHFNNGIYMLRIESNNEVSTMKIVKTE
ncbi:MAG: carbohydrate-binding protein [Bacteroidales bacterium]|nr:carbohydrate-binding protein [Bacteroidales bacterium]